MIKLHMKDKEIDIDVEFSAHLGAKPKITLIGEGDLTHHLIEGVFNIIDRLARMEMVDHSSIEWKSRNKK